MARSVRSVVLECGGCLGVRGESGVGKTTLARIAAVIEAPSSGIVMIDGAPVIRRHGAGKKLLARTAQMIWQDAPGSLDPRQRVGSIIAEPFVIHGYSHQGRDTVKDRVASLLKEVGLAADFATRYPHQLSGGEAQRVVIARALSLEPRLLVCDEPASALDIRARGNIARLLIRWRSERKLALLVVTHDLYLSRWQEEEGRV